MFIVCCFRTDADQLVSEFDNQKLCKKGRERKLGKCETDRIEKIVRSTIPLQKVAGKRCYNYDKESVHSSGLSEKEKRSIQHQFSVSSGQIVTKRTRVEIYS